MALLVRHQQRDFPIPGVYSTMTLKNAAALAFVGMALLTILLLAAFIRDLLAFLNNVIPVLRLLASLIYLFAAFSLTVFLYVIHKSNR
jgi:hypothetical protein